MAVPALSWMGVTPGSCLRETAAAVMSSQLFGCQSAGRPTWPKSFLLKKITRPSVPTGTPYRLPSNSSSFCTASGIWPQPSQASTLSLPTTSLRGLTWPPCANSPSQMPSSSTMSPPMSVLKSSAILALYSPSSTPVPSNLTLTSTPLAFSRLVNSGITQSLIHRAPRSFLPPATELAVIVRVTSFASAFFVESDSCCCPRQPARPIAATVVAANASVRRPRISAPLVSSSSRWSFTNSGPNGTEISATGVRARG